jgi:hypothetical protein
MHGCGGRPVCRDGAPCRAPTLDVATRAPPYTSAANFQRICSGRSPFGAPHGGEAKCRGPAAARDERRGHCAAESGPGVPCAMRCRAAVPWCCCCGSVHLLSYSPAAPLTTPLLTFRHPIPVAAGSRRCRAAAPTWVRATRRRHQAHVPPGRGSSRHTRLHAAHPRA